jgi:hypothetical protein
VIAFGELIRDTVLSIFPKLLKLVSRKDLNDQEKVAEMIPKICQEKDIEFLMKFAYTQMFCCMLDDYIDRNAPKI